MSESAENKQSVGSVWEIPTKTDVSVVRPDGSSRIVASDGKVALYFLDVPGIFSTDDVSVKAV